MERNPDSLYTERNADLQIELQKIQFADLNQKYQDLLLQLKQSKFQIPEYNQQSLNEIISQKDSELNQLKSLLDKEKLKVEAFKSLHNNDQSKIDELTKEINNSSTKINTLKSDISQNELRNNISLKSLKNELNTLLSEKEELEKRCADLTKESQENSEKYLNGLKTLDENNQTIHSLNTEITRVRKKLNNNKNDIKIK